MAGVIRAEAGIQCKWRHPRGSGDPVSFENLDPGSRSLRKLGRDDATLPRLLHHGSNSDVVELGHSGFARNGGIAHDREQQRHPERDDKRAQPVAITPGTLERRANAGRSSMRRYAGRSRAEEGSSCEPLARSIPSAAASDLERREQRYCSGESGEAFDGVDAYEIPLPSD